MNNPIDSASNERALATVRTVAGIVPIEGADAIELAKILGWQCVIKKGDMHPGDMAVYFEVDSFLPEDSRFEFLRRTSFRVTEFMGRGFRIKTMKMRGEISQGLLLSLSLFPEIPADIETGADVTRLLGVRKWYVPEVQTGAGTIIGAKPYGIPTTDELRIQSVPELIDALHGNPYAITTKMDGTSCTAFWKEDDFGCTSRNYAIKEETDTLYWAPERIYHLHDKLKSLGKNIAIQGELCGPGIQKNKLRLPSYEWFVFDIVNLDTREYFGFKEMAELCEKLELKAVPAEEEGDLFSYTLEEMLERAKGKYASGLDKEGIVVRSKSMKPRISFKTLNNDALLKEKD